MVSGVFSGVFSGSSKGFGDMSISFLNDRLTRGASIASAVTHGLTAVVTTITTLPDTLMTTFSSLGFFQTEGAMARSFTTALQSSVGALAARSLVSLLQRASVTVITVSGVELAMILAAFFFLFASIQGHTPDTSKYTPYCTTLLMEMICLLFL